MVDENRIIHVAKISVFMVSGSNGDKYAVSLFPKEKCECPAVRNCYHILAARISIGQNLHEKKAKVNMTQFTKNERKRCDKISGKKSLAIWIMKELQLLILN